MVLITNTLPSNKQTKKGRQRKNASGNGYESGRRRMTIQSLPRERELSEENLWPTSFTIAAISTWLGGNGSHQNCPAYSAAKSWIIWWDYTKPSSLFQAVGLETYYLVMMIFIRTYVIVPFFELYTWMGSFLAIIHWKELCELFFN